MFTDYAIEPRVAIFSPWFNFVLNHLWQSTVLAAVVALLTLALRGNHARTRYWLWLTASLKFLMPFSLLVSLGTQLGWPGTERITSTGLSVVMEEISQPFARTAMPVASPAIAQTASSIIPVALVGIWLCGCAAVLLFWCLRWRRVSVMVRESIRLTGGRELAALQRLQLIARVSASVRVVSSATSQEPGVFGILRPILLLPAGIADHLDDAQLEAIIAHEICHVRRRDNLLSAIHMFVEAIFWFHPLVWWLGARLIDEREHACDEEVLRLGSEPEVYAEGILKVCEFYLGSPVACVAGVTGSNLKKRIEGIMTHSIASKLNFTTKLMLATVGLAAVAAPIVIGALNASQVRAQSPAADPARPSFEVASIKPSGPDDNRAYIQIAPGGRLNARNITMKFLIQHAYGIRDFQISGGPSWLGSEHYDIVAKGESGEEMNPDRLKLMIQSLLADRFQLAFHKESKELPVYALVVAKNGPKLQESNGNERGPMIRMGRGQVNGKKMSMTMLASQLAQQLGRSVVDKTGLTKEYDISLEWTPDPSERMGPGLPGPDSPPPVDSPGPSIFTALQEQLGLRLESQKGPVDIYVIDRAEKATEN